MKNSYFCSLLLANTMAEQNDYLVGMNEPQAQAVLHTKGPLMIIAGAGSGKTRVLTYRTAHLIKQGIDPFRILLLTFTNKAAGEMRHRIEGVIGPEAKSIWMGTFHSVFAKILRVESKYIGYTSNFTIYDTDDSKSLLRTIIKEKNLDDKIYKANAVFNRISSAKNRLLGCVEYSNNPMIKADDEASRMPEIGNLYVAYQTRMFKANAMDFDDLLFNTNVLFRDHPEVLHKYQHKFQHVMVDEFQDTNISQYLITKKLSAVHLNICVVGDDAQSIYAFRGADIQNILNFEKDYPDLTTIRLEQNYRSTNNIVQAANSVIAKNTKQLRKEVWTSNDEGTKIEVLKTASDNEEGRIVANSIFEAKMNYNMANNDFAILYRTNAQSRSFEESLRKLNIKYRIIGGLSFYQRKEIKDLIAYLRFSINQSDEEAFKRIINFPKRGIGDATIAKIAVTAAENDMSVWEVLQNIHHFGAGRFQIPIEAFSHLIKSFILQIEQGKDAFTVASSVAKSTGILKELYDDKTVEGLARYQNIQELLNAIKEFVDNPENEDKSLPTFLESVSLLTTADTAEDPKDNDKVTMMTVHGSKGLEFKYVYIVGMEEELFPSQMMLQSRADLEEERRLFYVAITRAEKRLFLSYAESRYQWGRLKACEPSRFIDEIDTQYLAYSRNSIRALAEKQQTSTTGAMAEMVRKSGGFQLKTSVTPVKPTMSNVVHVPTENFAPSDPNLLAEGQAVEHQKFGFGTVKSLDISGMDKKATIQFKNAGEKTLLLNFAKLRIVD
jgi:DNA helicase II / ATP-dependent DNA helicase PcrA